MENRTMNKTLGITLTLIASMTFASTGNLKNPKEIYPNKKPLISSKTPTAVSVNSDNVRPLKVRKSIINYNNKKVKAVSSIDRPKRLRRAKRGR